jgi:hypothetical protein
MKKFDEVEQAKALMTEGLDWSVIKWIAEKKRVRKTADKANNLLWTTQKTLREFWSDELIAAYDALAGGDGNSDRQRSKQNGAAIDPEIKRLAHALKKADDEAYAAHLDAEETFQGRQMVKHRKGSRGMSQGDPVMGALRKSHSEI